MLKQLTDLVYDNSGGSRTPLVRHQTSLFVGGGPFVWQAVYAIPAPRWTAKPDMFLGIGRCNLANREARGKIIRTTLCLGNLWTFTEVEVNESQRCQRLED